MSNRPSYYAVIPASVRYDPALTANAKLLYGEITALCSKEGFCWATNAYFAELYDVSKTTVSEWITQLHIAEHINVVLESGRRRIYLLPLREKPKTPSGKAEDPLREKPKHSITDITTSNKDMWPVTRMSDGNLYQGPEMTLVNGKVRYSDHTYMTKIEYDKLVALFGKSTTAELIERVSDYVGSTGKKYKSHYHTIRNWLRRDGVKPRTSEKHCPNGHRYVGSLCRECGWSE